ncbi:MAG: bifunctional DNA primase/polymerase [Varibaculum cambriense]|uniref:bifunctional DNA primase/polymerase n=1 Tax=Varibaculum cambriense TaxID=184870 RepID=UPI001EBA048A|nr:bifunctional DNA primase/polymerase [Varibaculum cambriense]MBS5918027.1 bifunctional DNA primase/polymerase [Varibaculum cambriense]
MRKNKTPRPYRNQPGENELTNSNPILSAALRYAACGWQVLPCLEQDGKQAGKTAKAPYYSRALKLEHGAKSASGNPELIRQWWKKWPRALIGLAIPRHLVVIDLDPRNGGTLAALEAAIGETLPRCPVVVSGRGDGGCHLYYQRPARLEGFTPLFGQVICDDGTTLPGVDVKTAGGYVIAPPSPHPETGKPYRWQGNEFFSPPAYPQALGKLIERPPRPQPLAGKRVSRAGFNPVAGANMVSGLLATVAQARQGSRNNALFWAACRMQQNELAGAATDWQGLRQAALATGLTEWETDATILSARRRIGGNNAA